MSLLENIKEHSVVARKAGDKVAGMLLTTLYAEAAAVGKNNGNRTSTDEEVTKIVRKFINGVDEVLKLTPDDHRFRSEKLLLSAYLPPELTDQNIEDTLEYVKKFQTLSMKSMPNIKAYIDEKWPNAYDGKRVSEALRKRI